MTQLVTYLKFDFLLFLLSSIFARGLRFLLIGLIINFLGDKSIIFLKKYKFLIFFIIPLVVIIVILIIKYLR